MWQRGRTPGVVSQVKSSRSHRRRYDHNLRAGIDPRHNLPTRCKSCMAAKRVQETCVDSVIRQGTSARLRHCELKPSDTTRDTRDIVTVKEQST